MGFLLLCLLVGGDEVIHCHVDNIPINSANKVVVLLIGRKRIRGY